MLLSGTDPESHITEYTKIPLNALQSESIYNSLILARFLPAPHDSESFEVDHSDRGRGRRRRRARGCQSVIEMIWWTGLAQWEFEFTFPGSLISTFQGPTRCFHN